MLKHTREQIDIASECIANFNKSRDTKTAIRIFHLAIYEIDRIYNYLKDELKSKNHLLSGINVARGSDKLLSYLMHARNSKEHSIKEITKVIPGGWGLRPIGNILSIEKMIVKNGRIIEYKGSPAIVELIPTGLELLPVRDRGKEYPIPTEHLSKSVGKLTPKQLLEIGRDYYAGKIVEIEQALNV